MTIKPLNHQAFSVVEGLLILVILAIVSLAGFYVWHANHAATKNLLTSSSMPATKNVAPDYNAHLQDYHTCIHTGGSSLVLNANVCRYADGSTVPHPLTDPATKGHYITISQWGVRAFYNGSQDISYTMGDTNSAAFSSRQLTALSSACKGYGGLIARNAPTDQVDGGYGTAQNYVATLDKSDYTLINGYYYIFMHAQGGCGNSMPEVLTTEALQQLLNDTVKSFIPKLQAVPTKG